MNDRQNTILNMIEADGQVAIKQLQEKFPEVSLMTIHRDLDALCTTGRVTKIRGGARSVRYSSESMLRIRERENKENKLVIVDRTLQFLKPGSSIFIDAGSTNMLLAKALPDISLTVFTTAPNIAIELSSLVNPSINLCCGVLNRSNLSVSGYNTIDMIRGINIDMAFIGVSGCSATEGFTCALESDMRLKQLVISKARTSIALCDSSKLTRLMPYTFASLGELDYLITDGEFPADFLEKAKQAGLTVI